MLLNVIKNNNKSDVLDSTNIKGKERKKKSLKLISRKDSEEYKHQNN